MRPALAALLLLAGAARARAQDGAPARIVETPAVRDARERLETDPSAVDALAARIAGDSRLVGLISADPDPARRLRATEDWIKNDSDAAARLALGLAGDRAAGNSAYEDGLFIRVKEDVTENPGARNNLYNRLRRAAKSTRLMSKQGEGMSSDEQSEIMRTLFEGKGSESARVLTQKDAGRKAAPAAPATSFSGYYDRLSAGNLRGYSPQLMALQSALSRSRPPGAPALVETGKLDYATLSYPAYGMEFDVNNLEGRLRRDRILELARLAGVRPGPRDWRDPAALEARLSAKVPAGKLPPRLAERAALAGKARDALQSFLAAAEVSKDPRRITRGLLVDLGRRQREAARWITAAALDEELSAVEALDGFLSPELTAAIAAAPAPEAARAAYLRRAQALDRAVKTVEGDARRALDLLQSDSWASSLAEVDRLNTEIRALKASLPADVAVCARVPFLALEAFQVQPRWRVYLDDLAVKWAPGLAYSRGVAARRAALSRALGAYGLVASGDLAGARRDLGGDAAGR